jgi:K+-transporting ATPase A subunit
VGAEGELTLKHAEGAPIHATPVPLRPGCSLKALQRIGTPGFTYFNAHSVVRFENASLMEVTEQNEENLYFLEQRCQ